MHLHIHLSAFNDVCVCVCVCVCACVRVCAHSWEDPEWIKAADTPGSVLLREPAVRSGIRDQRRLSSLLLALCGVCHSKLALSHRHRSTIRLDSPEIIAVTTGQSSRLDRPKKEKKECRFCRSLFSALKDNGGKRHEESDNQTFTRLSKEVVYSFILQPYLLNLSITCYFLENSPCRHQYLIGFLMWWFEVNTALFLCYPAIPN